MADIFVTIENAGPNIFVDMVDESPEISVTVQSAGPPGEKGNPGTDGYTPVRGIDYWTDQDKAEIIAETVAALPVYNGEVQDVG